MKSKELVINIGVLAITIIIMFFLIEIGFRIFTPPTQTVKIEDRTINGSATAVSFEEKAETGLRNLFYFKESGGRLRPNSRVTLKDHYVSGEDVVIETNSLGYRDKEIGGKDPNKIRILFLGDSITFGDYLDEEETYVRILENLINKDITTRQVEMINGAVGGVNLQTELAILMDSGLSLKPDIVFIALYLNDASYPLYIKPTILGFPFSKSRFLSWMINRIDLMDFLTNEIEPSGIVIEDFKNFIENNPIKRGVNFAEDKEVFNYLIAKNYKDWGYAWTDPAWKEIGKLMRIIKQLEQENDFKTVVALFPVDYQVLTEFDSGEPQDDFNELMKELNIPHLDILPYLKLINNETPIQQLYYDHCHYNKLGNILIAQKIKDFLEDEKLI